MTKQVFFTTRASFRAGQSSTKRMPRSTWNSPRRKSRPSGDRKKLQHGGQEERRIFSCNPERSEDTYCHKICVGNANGRRLEGHRVPSPRENQSGTPSLWAHASQGPQAVWSAATFISAPKRRGRPRAEPPVSGALGRYCRKECSSGLERSDIYFGTQAVRPTTRRAARIRSKAIL